eukprot:COSAG01_NODE_4047_length_5403_cov_2.337670_7_plen_100_part_00
MVAVDRIIPAVLTPTAIQCGRRRREYHSWVRNRIGGNEHLVLFDLAVSSGESSPIALRLGTDPSLEWDVRGRCRCSPIRAKTLCLTIDLSTSASRVYFG